MNRIKARTVSAFCFALAVVVTGCSSEPTRHAVSGTVTIDGQPAALTTVKFLPTGASPPPSGGTGTTDESGKFTIGENGKNTGLLAGEYKVTFSQTLIRGKPSRAGSGGKASEREAGEKEGVPDAYRDPANTPASATVGSKSTSFQFEIKR